jgi:hypothetical protein
MTNLKMNPSFTAVAVLGIRTPERMHGPLLHQTAHEPGSEEPGYFFASHLRFCIL